MRRRSRSSFTCRSRPAHRDGRRGAIRQLLIAPKEFHVPGEPAAVQTHPT